MMNKETYQKAVLTITTFRTDGIHTDLDPISGSGVVASGDMMTALSLSSPISGLAPLIGNRESFGS